MHIAGERLFVDFAGHTMEVIDAATGEIQRAEIFVAVLGASSFIYAEATASQALADWIGAHVNALSRLGGVPRQIVSDNLKSGINKPRSTTRHKPQLRRDGRALQHRGGASAAAKAADKAKASY